MYNDANGGDVRLRVISCDDERKTEACASPLIIGDVAENLSRGRQRERQEPQQQENRATLRRDGGTGMHKARRTKTQTTPLPL